MDNKEYNEKAINDVYKNAHIALQSISDILPSVDDEGLKVELKEQYEGYERVIGEISTFMAENNITPKDVNPLKKAMLWSSIKMKTMFDNSKNQIAEMMIKGNTMGVNKMTKHIRNYDGGDSNIRMLAKKMLDTEEEHIREMKAFL